MTRRQYQRRRPPMVSRWLSSVVTICGGSPVFPPASRAGAAWAADARIGATILCVAVAAVSFDSIPNSPSPKRSRENRVQKGGVGRWSSSSKRRGEARRGEGKRPARPQLENVEFGRPKQKSINQSIPDPTAAGPNARVPQQSDDDSQSCTQAHRCTESDTQHPHTRQEKKRKEGKEANYPSRMRSSGVRGGGCRTRATLAGWWWWLMSKGSAGS